LEAWEIFQHASKAQLLTLSACNTDAIPGQTRGYSIASLAHRAGAAWVLASRWKVDDPSTAVFMSEFYRNAIATGGSLAGAFQFAKRGAKTRNPEASRIYAPFVLSVRSVSALL
jgi:CHAT domain-containing protein